MSKKFTEKSYRLLNDRSGQSLLLKVGKNRRLLVFDEDKGFNRAIRHCPNEQTIYVDEQSDFALVEPIVFEFGTKDVKATDQLTQLFLDTHPDNKVNGGVWFEEINEEQEAQESIETEEVAIRVKQAIMEKAKEDEGIYDLEAVVAVLTGSAEQASRMKLGELKRELFQAVNMNPYNFISEEGEVNIFDDESTNLQYMVLRAIREGVLIKSTTKRSILWGKEKTVILTAPQGVQDLTEYFADYLTTDEGMIVLEGIKRRL